MINCLVVDDEPIAREGMMEYVRQIDYLNLVAQCKSAAEAAGLLQKHKIDLIFLDIQMPKLTGIEFVKALAEPPLVIFTTAYSEYALEGFELDVVDYLLKPISFARFLKAVEKAQNYLHARNKEVSITSDFFFVKCNGKIEKIMMAEVVYIEAMANYVIIYTKQKKYITYLTFSGIEEQLPAELFVRIHKSFLVAISAIQTIDGNEAHIVGEKKTLAQNQEHQSLAVKMLGFRHFIEFACAAIDVHGGVLWGGPSKWLGCESTGESVCESGSAHSLKPSTLRASRCLHKTHECLLPTCRLPWHPR